MARKDEPLIGAIIDGRYQLVARIGEGGMGVVYQARQTSVDRMVAIKMLSPHLARDPSWIQRFFNEAKACSRLQHPNTIRMFDFGQTREGHFFMAMELLEGLSLRRVIAAAAPMDSIRVLRILIQCCASLSEAHNLGIIHRDIKSDNVYIIDVAGQGDHVKLLDFSVAKLLQGDGHRTQAGVIVGTPEYMSPEQARGEPLGPRSDLYALGILAYEMLSGSVPFTDPDPMNVLGHHIQSPVPPLPPGTLPELAALVRRALEKDQKLRFPSAAAMMEHAQQLLARLTSGAYRPMASAPPSAPPGGPGAAWPGDWTLLPPVPDQAPPVATASSPGRRTMVAEYTSPQAAGAASRPGRAPSGAGSGHGAPLRTMLLPDTSGVVSLSEESSRVAASGGGGSAVFWLLCLLTGVVVGVAAYWLVLHLER